MRSQEPIEGPGCALPAFLMLLTGFVAPWLLTAGLIAVFVGAMREDVPALLGVVAFFQIIALLSGHHLTAHLGFKHPRDHLRFLGWLLASCIVVVVVGLGIWIA